MPNLMIVFLKNKQVMQFHFFFETMVSWKTFGLFESGADLELFGLNAGERIINRSLA